ncbi:MAG TPA: aminotransferase class V-fold PLP-dependent enzyme, partial [Myxococcaceae bacterium]|nr:aminotransferase class V-fold PLP-dependent enzyme [Myxococcaceae bacterium]
PVDVVDLDCDFYAFSGHKLFGPMGIGVLYGKKERLESMPPYQGGGDMILSVTLEKTLYNRVPYRFEAGTPDISGAVGLAAALDYIDSVGLDAIAAHDRDLLEYGAQALETIPGLKLLGRGRERSGVLSFIMEDVHAHDVGTILDREGVAIRAGHHCAQPLLSCFGVAATVRASLAMYNTREDIDALVRGLHKVREVFA